MTSTSTQHQVKHLNIGFVLADTSILIYYSYRELNDVEVQTLHWHDC